MPNAEYRVNKSTGQVIKDDGTGWKPVASVRNKSTGEILIDEGSGWQPLPSQQRNLTPDPAMNMASQRANQALAGGQKIAQDDLTQLGKLDFSPAAMGKLAAPTMSEPELDAWTIERMDALERARIPDSDTKERMIAAMNGPTFGNGPRLAAASQTLGALLATPFVEGDIIDQKGLSGAASQFLDEARVHQRRGRDERMAESMALEIVPALFQGKTIVDTLGKKFIPGTTMASNVGRFSGVGGLYGALYGASQSEKGNLGGVAEDAAFGGALGAGFGLGMKALQPAATAGVRSAKTAGASLYDALAGALGKAGGARDRVAEDVAVAAVRRSMDRSGLTFDEIMALVKKYEGKPAVLAEVIGQDAVNALTALTRRPGSTPQKAQAIQEERVFARPERMIGDVEDATGIAVGQLDDTLAKQLEERQAAAKPIYDALYKRFNKIEAFRQPGQTGQVMKRINRLARTPLAQRHLQLAKDAVATIAGRRGIAVSKMSTMEYWDLVKRSLDDAINSAQSKGEARTRVGEGIDDLVGLKNDLVDELDRLTGGAYAAAREVGGEAPRLKAAAASGQKVMQARNPREVAKTVAATAPQDLPALRAGVVEDLGTRINKGMLPSRVRVPDIANKLRASLGEKSANKLINRLDAEASLAETGARWAPRLNSVTGTVMENGATQMGDDLINAGFNLATGNKLGLFRQAINFMRQRGFSQRQIDAIGDLLLSSPEEGLRRLKVMTPDGLPAGAAAPLAGTASGGGLPPSGGAPMGAASPAASPIRAGGFAGFPTGRFNKRPRSTPESMADHDEKLTNLFGGNPPPPRTPRDVEIERLSQVERDALAELDELDKRVVDMGVDPAILEDRRILPSDVSPNAWPQVQEIMAQMDDAATRLMRARDEMSGLRNAPEGDAFGAPSPPNPPRTMGQGLGAGLRNEAGQQVLAGGFGSIAGSTQDLNDDGKIDWQDAAIGAVGALGAVNAPRVVGAARNAFANGARRTVGTRNALADTATAGVPGKTKLDMAPEAVKARAREQGFDTDTIVYHGTNTDFKAFDPKRSIGGQYWSTTNKAAVEAREVGAQGNGVIKAMYQRIKNPAGWAEYDKYGVDELIARGYDGLRLPDRDGHFTFVAFHPNQYRSVNAAFDPDKAASPILTAGIGGGGRKPPWREPPNSTARADADAEVRSWDQGGSGNYGQKTAVERARGRPNEVKLLEIRKRQIQYDNGLNRKAIPGWEVPAQSRMEIADINARLKELRSQQSDDLPPIMGNGFGFGGGGRGPRKPSGGGIRTAEVGKRAADLAAIGTLANAPPAQAQTADYTAEITAAKERANQIEKQAIPQLEADLRMLEDPAGDPFKLQELLQRRGDYDGKIDGKIGPLTRQAIADNAKRVRQEIETQRNELKLAREAVKQAEIRAAQARAEPSASGDILNKAAWGASFLAGGYLAYRMRNSAALKSIPAAQAATRKANALLNSKPLSRAKTGPDSLNARAGNINDFWRQGGAKRQVPFEADDTGAWRARPNAKQPSEIFGRAPHVRGNDIGFMVTAGIDAGASRLAINHFDKEIAEADADIEKFTASGDIAGLERALARKKTAKGAKLAAEVMERLGWGYIAGRGAGALKAPYARVAPNMAKAEAERALLLQAMNRQPKPKPTPKQNKGQGNP